MFNIRSKNGHSTTARQEQDALYASLRADLDRIDSQVRTLKVEWLDTLERIERVLGRIAKRAERAGIPATDPPTAEPAQPVDPITARVLARRRAAHGVPGAVREDAR